jgi:CelD/BcsL family acetyltransferase involved in cellulose biosynthesis
LPSAFSDATHNLSVRRLADENRSAAKEAWLQLERRVGEVALACSWDWTEVWLDHFGDIVGHDFLVVTQDGVPCAVLILTRGVGRRRSRIPLSTLHVGTAGEPEQDTIYVEYNRVLVVPEMRQDVARSVLAAIQEDDSWDELHLDGFAPEDADPFLAADPKLKPRFEPCPTVDLKLADKQSGDIVSTLTSNTRYQIRRSIRAFGDVQSEWAETTDQALDILDELARLHQKRWGEAGRPGVFSSARFVEFHRALVKRLFPKGLILLYRVRSPLGTIGCLYSFIERSNVLSYQLGLARFADNKMKPGFVTHALCMQSSYERGLADYNFLAGDDPWKRELATTERQLVWATASRRRLKLAVADALGATKRLVTRGNGRNVED